MSKNKAFTLSAEDKFEILKRRPVKASAEEILACFSAEEITLFTAEECKAFVHLMPPDFIIALTSHTDMKAFLEQFSADDSLLTAALLSITKKVKETPAAKRSLR